MKKKEQQEVIALKASNGWVSFDKFVADDIFGKFAKHDLPKWCKKNGFICMYRPQTLEYLIISGEYKEV